MPKVILEKVVTVYDKDGNPRGFGAGLADVPDELMPKVAEAAARRRFKITPIEEFHQAPDSAATIVKKDGGK
jgi:hypothetical protein